MQLIYTCLNKIALKRKFVLIITAQSYNIQYIYIQLKLVKFLEKTLCFLAFFIIIFYCFIIIKKIY